MSLHSTNVSLVKNEKLQPTHTEDMHVFIPTPFELTDTQKIVYLFRNIFTFHLLYLPCPLFCLYTNTIF